MILNNKSIIGTSGGGGSTTNAADLTSGTLADARLSSNVTVEGNTFNGANQLVQLDGSGNLPAIDGSALTNVSGSSIELITEQTVSGSSVSQIEFTSLSLSDYYKVEAIIDNGNFAAAGTSGTLQMTINGITSSDYFVYETVGSVLNASGLGESEEKASIGLIAGNDNAIWASKIQTVVTLFDPGVVGRKKFESNWLYHISATGMRGGNVVGLLNDTDPEDAAITSLQFFMHGGANLDIGTHIKLIGYKQ